VTSVVNVLETCGVLSFNLSPRQLRSLYAYFDRRFAVRIVAGPAGSPLITAGAEDLFGYVGRRLSLAMPWSLTPSRPGRPRPPPS
jgi:hypothetical protein